MEKVRIDHRFYPPKLCVGIPSGYYMKWEAMPRQSALAHLCNKPMLARYHTRLGARVALIDSIPIWWNKPTTQRTYILVGGSRKRYCRTKRGYPRHIGGVMGRTPWKYDGSNAWWSNMTLEHAGRNLPPF